jgi:zinc protease
MRADAMLRVTCRLLSGCLILVAIGAEATPRIEQWRTAFGSRVLFIEEHALPMIDVEVSFQAGTAYDPPGREGLAALVAENLNDGTEQRDEETLARALADVGAQLAVHSDPDRAALSLRTLSAAPQRDPAVGVLEEILKSPTFPEAALERERARSLAALRQSFGEPEGLAERAFYPRLFPGHGYGQVVSEASLQALRREDLVAFRAQHYRADGAVIALVGDLSSAAAHSLAERLSSALPAGPAPAVLPPVLPVSGPARVDIAHPAAQAHLLLGLQGFAYGDPDYVALMVANYVLGGGGFSSRLTDEVREKRGLVYSVESHFTPQLRAGPFEISLQTRRDQAPMALALVRRILADFVRDGPSAAELRDARQHLVGGFPLRLDSNRKLLGFLSTIGFYQLPADWMEAYPRAIAGLTLAQVRDAIRRRVHPDQLLTVVVGGDAP